MEQANGKQVLNVFWTKQTTPDLKDRLDKIPEPFGVCIALACIPYNQEFSLMFGFRSLVTETKRRISSSLNGPRMRIIG